MAMAWPGPGPGLSGGETDGLRLVCRNPDALMSVVDVDDAIIRSCRLSTLSASFWTTSSVADRLPEIPDICVRKGAGPIRRTAKKGCIITDSYSYLGV
jgi:hypothetical protein